MLSLGVRDLKPGKDNVIMSDLTPRQIAYATAGCLNYVVVTDLLEIGGEMETRQARRITCKTACEED